MKAAEEEKAKQAAAAVEAAKAAARAEALKKASDAKVILVSRREELDKAIKDRFDSERLVYLAALCATKPEDQDLTLQIDFDVDSKKGSTLIPYRMTADASVLGGYRVVYDRLQLCQALVDSYALETSAIKVYQTWESNVLACDRLIFHPPNKQYVEGSKLLAQKFVYDAKWLTDEGLRSLLSQHEKGNYHDGVQTIRDALVASFLHSPFDSDRRIQRKVESLCMDAIRKGLAEANEADFATCKVSVRKENAASDEYVCRNLDMWCPALYINVECDERDHKGYPANYSELRNADITDVYSLKVEFIPFNPQEAGFNLETKVAEIVQRFKNIQQKRRDDPEFAELRAKHIAAAKDRQDKIKEIKLAKAQKAKEAKANKAKDGEKKEEERAEDGDGAISDLED